MKIRLRTCLLFVKNIEKSKEFYKNLFGIQPTEDLIDFTSFKFEETFFNLHLADSKNPLSDGGSVGYFFVEQLEDWINRAAFLGAQNGGSVGYFFVEQLEDWINRAAFLGAQIWRGPLDTGTGFSIVQIKDPFGNVIGFEALSDPI